MFFVYRCSLDQFLELGRQEGQVPELTFEQLPFNHPLFIMYSSGTTGVPKCMVHSAGVGMLVLHLPYVDIKTLFCKGLYCNVCTSRAAYGYVFSIVSGHLFE